MKLTVNNH